MDKFQPRFVYEFATYLLTYQKPSRSKALALRVVKARAAYQRGLISAMEAMNKLMEINEMEG